MSSDRVIYRYPAQKFNGWCLVIDPEGSHFICPVCEYRMLVPPGRNVLTPVLDRILDHDWYHDLDNKDGRPGGVGSAPASVVDAMLASEAEASVRLDGQTQVIE